METQNIDLNTFLGLLDNGLRREGDETFVVLPEGIGAFHMDDHDWRLLSREEQAPLLEFESEARLAFPCSLEAVRAWVERNWHEMPESLAKALEEAQEAPASLAMPEEATEVFNPRDLELLIEVNPGRIIVTHRKTKAERIYTRDALLGKKATATWMLLCLFGRYYNAVPGTLPDGVKKLNSSYNRRNLGNKLKETLSLSERPVIPRIPSALTFASITTEREGIDAMDRQTAGLGALEQYTPSYDGEDAADLWLRANDSDYHTDH